MLRAIAARRSASARARTIAIMSRAAAAWRSSHPYQFGMPGMPTCVRMPSTARTMPNTPRMVRFHTSVTSSHVHDSSAATKSSTGSITALNRSAATPICCITTGAWNVSGMNAAANT